MRVPHLTPEILPPGIRVLKPSTSRILGVPRGRPALAKGYQVTEVAKRVKELGCGGPPTTRRSRSGRTKHRVSQPSDGDVQVTLFPVDRILRYVKIVPRR